MIICCEYSQSLLILSFQKGTMVTVLCVMSFVFESLVLPLWSLPSSRCAYQSAFGSQIDWGFHSRQLGLFIFLYLRASSRGNVMRGLCPLNLYCLTACSNEGLFTVLEYSGREIPGFCEGRVLYTLVWPLTKQ